MKLNLLAALFSFSLIYGNSLPVAADSGQRILRASKAADLSGEWYSMENGDNSISGKGSVTDELTRMFGSYDFSRIQFRSGNEVLAVAPGGDLADSGTEIRSFYIYTFEPVHNFDKFYDHVIISSQYKSGDFSSFVNSSLVKSNYTPYALTLSSENVDKHLFKYKVQGFDFDVTKNYYLDINRLYCSSNSEDLDFVLPVGFNWQYRASDHKFYWVTEDSITVDKKMVAYSLYNTTDATDTGGGMIEGRNLVDRDITTQRLIQQNYVAFNLSQQVDNISALEVSYTGTESRGQLNQDYLPSTWYDQDQNINLVTESNCFAIDMASRLVYRKDSQGNKVLRNSDSLFKSFDKRYGYQDKLPSKDSNGNTCLDHDVIIKPKTVSINYEADGWWGSKSHFDYSYKTLMPTSELKDDGLVNPSIKKDYTWIATFDTRFVDFTQMVSVETKLGSDWNMCQIGAPWIGYRCKLNKNDPYSKNTASRDAARNCIVGAVFGLGGGITGLWEQINSYPKVKTLYTRPYEFAPCWNGWDPVVHPDYSSTSLESNSCYQVWAHDDWLEEGYAPLDVSNFTMLRLWYTKDGEAKTAPLVDTYQKSSGLVPVQDPTLITDDGKDDGLLKKILIALVCVALLIVLAIVMRFVPFAWDIAKAIGKGLLFVLKCFVELFYLVLVWPVLAVVRKTQHADLPSLWIWSSK